ncbi:MAG: hypothetical protein K0S65_1473, partial [Labilithrix sp.]|nr:hypothetical protein [Labilithrix sp.]
VWSSGYGNSATGSAIAADAMGNLFAAGHFANSIDFGSGAHASARGAFGADDVFLAKLAP